MFSWLTRAMRLIVLLALFVGGQVPCASYAQAPDRIALEDASAIPAITPVQKTWQEPLDTVALPPNSAFTGVTLQMRLSVEQRKELSDLLVSQTTLSSPSYHKWLTPADFARRFSPDENSTAAVMAWLGLYGLKVTSAGTSGRFLKLSGTAAQVGAAFGVTFRVVRSNGRDFVASSPALSAPTQIAEQLEGVRGFNERKATSYKCCVPAISAESMKAQATYFAAGHGIPELRQRGLDGAGVSIGLIAPDSTVGRMWLDVIAPSATIVTDAAGIFEVAGAPVPPNPDWISRLATLVEADTIQILALPALGCEFEYSPAEWLATKALVEQASVEGISVISEASDCTDSADFPAVLSQVTGVGKTGHYFQVSRSEVKPEWQNVSGMPSDSHRDTADISFEASESDGSFPSVAFAAGGALLLQGLELQSQTVNAVPMSIAQGPLNPVLYSLATTNGAFARVGARDNVAYSLTEGLGQPDFAVLLKTWPNANVGTTTTATQLTSSSYNATTGTSIALRASITSSSASGMVTFTDATAGTLGTATISGGVATLTLATLTAGSHTIAATYSGDATYAASTSASIGIYLTNDSTPVTGALTTALSSASISYGSTTTLRAGVTLTSGIAAGSVTASVNGVTYTGTLSGGTVTLTIASPPPGTYLVMVACVMNAAYTCSATSSVLLTVTGAASTTNLTASVSTTLWGSSVTFTTSIDSGATALGAPTGAVTFYDTVGPLTSNIGTATIGSNGEFGGVASLSTTGLQAGAHTIHAFYSGSPSFLSSASITVIVTVQDFAMTFSPSSLTIAQGRNGTVTGMLVAVSGFSGTVSLSCTPPASSMSTCTTSHTSLEGNETTLITVATGLGTSSVRPPSFWGLTGTSLTGLFTLPFLHKRRLSAWIALVFVASVLCGANGCSSAVAIGTATATSTPLGTSLYVVTAAGTDGTHIARHSYPIQVTVQ